MPRGPFIEGDPGEIRRDAITDRAMTKQDAASILRDYLAGDRPAPVADPAYYQAVAFAALFVLGELPGAKP